jgi:hypothetical protein
VHWLILGRKRETFSGHRQGTAITKIASGGHEIAATDGSEKNHDGASPISSLRRATGGDQNSGSPALFKVPSCVNCC